MYAKILSHLDDDPCLGRNGNLVVPKKTTLIEGRRFEYRKYFGDSVDQILNSNNLNGLVLSSLSESEQGVELIHLEVYGDDKDADPAEFVAASSSLFIMNADGDTIDVLQCYSPASVKNN